MITKLIAWGPDRDAARLRLAATLEETVIWPLKTNAGFLVKALHHSAFAKAELDTGLIAREGDALLPATIPSDDALAQGAAALAAPGPLAGVRLNAPRKLEGRFLLDGTTVTVALKLGASGAPQRAALVAEGGQVWQLLPWRAGGAGGSEAVDGSILSPMPGRVIAVAVACGQSVTAGQKLLTLEAMKMEHSLVAPFDGTIAELNVSEGGQVSEGALLVKVKTAEAA